MKTRVFNRLASRMRGMSCSWQYCLAVSRIITSSSESLDSMFSPSMWSQEAAKGCAPNFLEAAAVAG